MPSVSFDEFVRRSMRSHEGKYVYFRENFTGMKNKTKILCPDHGVFFQNAYGHSIGKVGCSKCRGVNELTIESAKLASVELFNGFYSVLGLCKKSGRPAIRLLCKKHGEFTQRASHYFKGIGCNECGHESSSVKRSLTTTDFINKAKGIHGDKYDYSETKYTRSIRKVRIKCNIHGVFLQTPNCHLDGNGCPNCYGKQAIGLERFIYRSKLVFGDTYDYSRVEYVNTRTPVAIGCKKHGFYEKQPKWHLLGSGCPVCKVSTGELEVRSCLDNLGIDYEPEFTSETLINPKTGRKLRIDFFIRDYSLAIEFDGVHHYWLSVDGRDSLNVVKNRDRLKDDWCNENGINMLRIPYWKKSNIKEIISACVKRLE